MDQPYFRLGTFRQHISLVEIGSDIVRWHWEDLGRDAGEDLQMQVQKTEETLKEANDYLHAWGLPKRTIVLEPPLRDDRPPPLELIDYKKGIPDHYIRPKCHDETEKDKGLLDNYVQAWLKDPKRKLLAVLGDYGIGKTSFCYKFAADLSGSQFIPVVIELKRVRGKNLPEAIQEAIDRRVPQGSDKIVLILDGFDELSVTFDKDTVDKYKGELSEPAQKYQKVILTSRTQFFRSREEEVDRLGLSVKESIGHKPLSPYKLFERIYISLFDNEQIKEYLRLSLCPQEAQDFWSRTIEKVFDMKDLSRRPILTHLIVENPDVIRDVRGKVTSGRLYEVITEYWREREEGRIPPYIEVDQKG
jgi:hypothetical protein